jgi:endoglucanase Acf2
MVLSTNSSDAMGASGYRSGPRFDYIPFPVVDREKYNDPASEIVNPKLFDPSLLFQGTAASSRTNRTVDPLLKVPFPTGAFWTNLVVKPTPDQGFSYPVVVYPYAYKWSETLLQASYPPLRRRTDQISIRDTFNPDVTFGTYESVAKRHIMAFDSLSVTVRFFLSSGGYWETYMVQGSPYVTNKYQDATPEIRALSIFSDVSCPFGADGNYKDGSGYDGRDLKWGVCTPYDPLSVSRLSLPFISERAPVSYASFSLFSRVAMTVPKD